MIRCDVIEGNQALARRPVVDVETGEETIDILIETRGEGGYVVGPNADPGCHPNGGMYRLVNGSLTSIPRITPEQREAMILAAASLNEYVEPSKTVAPKMPECVAPDTSGLEGVGESDERPGDAYNAREPWESVLGDNWSVHHTAGKVTYWKREGSEHQWGATTGACGDKLYVFSRAAAPLEAEKAYNKFAAYTFLNHGGDFSAATKALAARGFGVKRTASVKVRIGKLPAGPKNTEKGKAAQPITWEPICPFIDQNLPTFPVDALPEHLQQFGRAVAVSYQVPEDLHGNSQHAFGAHHVISGGIRQGAFQAGEGLGH